MRKGGGFQSHNIFDVLEDTQKKSKNNNNESDDDSEEQSYYCLEFSGLPLFVEKTQFLPITSGFGAATHLDCDKSGYVYAFYDQKHIATKTLMSVNGKRYQGKKMAVQFAPNKPLPATKKCYHCDKLGHFGIECVEGPFASLPEEIIALLCSFVNSITYDTTVIKVSKKWRKAIHTHTTYLSSYKRWSPLFDKFSNITTLFIYGAPPKSLKNFPKLQTLVADISVMNYFKNAEFPPTLKNIKIESLFHGTFVECALPQSWTQRTEFAGLESLSFTENIPGLPFTFKDVTHLTNLKRLNLPSFESPKEYLTSLTRLEHLGCAVLDDLTQFDAKILPQLTSFEPLRHFNMDMELMPPKISPDAHKWLLDHGQLRAISLGDIEKDFNFKIWPNLVSVSVADVPEIPEALDQLNIDSLTELNLTMGTTGMVSQLGKFTNLVKLRIDAYTASNNIFREIVKLTNLRHLEFSAQALFPAVDDSTVGLAKLPNLEYYALQASLEGLEDALFIDEICELPALKSLIVRVEYYVPSRFMKIIRRFHKVHVLQIYGDHSMFEPHHAIAIRHQVKGPEYITLNGVDVTTVTSCSCEECRCKNNASLMDRFAVDPAPAVLSMEDHMLDADEIRHDRSSEHEKKVKKHDKTKMQRIEKQGNLSEKEMRKKRNRRK